MFCWAEAQKRRVGALSIQTQGNNFSSKLYNTLEKLVETLCHRTSIYTSRVLFGGRDRRHSTQII